MTVPTVVTRRYHALILIERDLQVTNLTTRETKYAVYLHGFKNAPIQRVRLAHCDFEGVQKENVIEVQDISCNDVQINGKVVSSGVDGFRRNCIETYARVQRRVASDRQREGYAV
jgi:hypothetical protein